MRRRSGLLLLSAFLLAFYFWPRPSIPVQRPSIPAQFPKALANGNVPIGWHPFRPPDSYILPPYSTEPTLSQRLPCIEHWIVHGRACKYNEQSKMDVAWTWINGSEPILLDTRSKVEESIPKGPRRGAPFVGSRSTHFRTHNEMLYSMRSVLAALPAELVGQYILISADVAAEDTAELRLGSIPTWLDVESPVRILHHSDVFRVPILSDEKARSWRDTTVPSFNSLAIESQLPNVHTLAPTLLYLNDDCFLLRPLSPADFETSLYGPVFRIQLDLKVRSTPLDSVRMGVDREGEWPSLEHTNWLLDQRFGKRERRYLHHVAKVVSVPIMREAAAIWAKELATTAEARFRGHKPQVNLMYLTTWYTIEKHREALLYSFIILRADADANGHFFPTERQTLLDGLPKAPPRKTEIEIPITLRAGGHSSYVALSLASAGLATPRETEYTWLSSDGYPLIRTLQRSTANSDSSTYCTLDVSACLPEGKTPLEILRRVAFERPECGDCFIAHLINQSGPHGLAAFLPPPPDTTLPGVAQPEPEPEMELAKRWQDAKFHPGLGRAYAVNSIHRYSYVLGSSTMQFLALRRASDARNLPDPSSPVAFLAVNDDLRNPLATSHTDVDMRAWYKRRWGAVRGWWENAYASTLG